VLKILVVVRKDLKNILNIINEKTKIFYILKKLLMIIKLYKLKNNILKIL
jgi:hypothetical protein